MSLSKVLLVAMVLVVGFAAGVQMSGIASPAAASCTRTC